MTMPKRWELRGTVHDRPSPILERLPAVLMVEQAVRRSERRELLERAARLTPRYPAAHDHGVTGRNA